MSTEAVAPESTATETSAANETYSASYVADLKAQLARQSEANSAMKARQEAEDGRKRECLTQLQPVVSEFVKEAVEDETMQPFKHEFGPLTSFAEGLSQATSLDTALPFARAISCHSAKFKRSLEQFSQVKDASERLAAANREIDEIKADRDAKASRITELEGLADERLKAAEEMQLKLMKFGGVTEKYDFSKSSARETAPPNGSAVSGAPGGAPSRAAPPVAGMDPLLQFVGRSGSGGLRIGQSLTSHHFLGNAGGGSDSNAADISAAIRAGGL
jgi:hypothetical protein